MNDSLDVDSFPNPNSRLWIRIASKTAPWREITLTSEEALELYKKLEERFRDKF